MLPPDHTIISIWPVMQILPQPLNHQSVYNHSEQEQKVPKIQNMSWCNDLNPTSLSQFESNFIILFNILINDVSSHTHSNLSEPTYKKNNICTNGFSSIKHNKLRVK